MRGRRRGSGSGWRAPEILVNVVPMIDVMMCLLIIFMLIQPSLRKGLDLQLPPLKDPAADTASRGAPDQLVLSVHPGNKVLLNDVAIPHDSVGARLRAVFASRVRKVLFVRGVDGVVYGDVLAAVDSARGAGVTVVGLVPRQP